LANTNFALAEVYLKANNYNLAKKHFKEAIKLYTLNETFELDELVASAYYQLGNIYTETFNLFDARVSYLKSLALFESLFKKDNVKFRPHLAAVYNNLGVTFKSMDDHQKALEYYQKALNNYRYLSENINALFLPYLAATYNSIAILYSEIKNFEKAVLYAHKACALYNDLAIQSPDEHSHYLATSLHNLGLFYFELRKFESSENYFKKALEMRRVLAINAPESFDPDVCSTALNLLELYQAQLEATLNLDFKSKCIKLLMDVEVRLAKFNDNRPVIKSMKSDCQYYKAYFSSITLKELELTRLFKKVDTLTEEINSTRLPNEKIIFQKKIVKLLKDAFKRYPENEKVINELAYAYNDLAWLNLRLGNFENAETVILKAFKLEQPIIALKCNLAHSLLLQNKFEQAKSLYLEIKSEKNSNNEPYSLTVLRDFKTLIEDGFNHHDFERIKEIL
jgi:tetratricopeptide (TPR) repeat protein